MPAMAHRILVRPSHPAVQELVPLKPRSTRRFLEREGVVVRRGRLLLVDVHALAARLQPTPCSSRVQ